MLSSHRISPKPLALRAFSHAARFGNSENSPPSPSPAAAPPKVSLTKGVEWIEAGTDGSYASATMGGIQTRKYHGALVINTQQPGERNLMVSRLEETLEIEPGNKIALSESLFKNQPTGLLKEKAPLLEKFSPYPVTTWIYKIPQIEGKLQKQVVFQPGQPTAVYGYTLSGDAQKPLTLKIKPFFNTRNIHTLTQSQFPFQVDQHPQGLTFRSEGKPAIFVDWRTQNVSDPSAVYTPNVQWYWDFAYPREADRGLEYTEHAVTSGELSVTLRPGEMFQLTLSTTPILSGAIDINAILAARYRTLEQLVDQTGLPKTPVNKMLVRAADQFLVQRHSFQGPTMIAGYPWSADWGRDMMIALPGIAFATKRFKEAESVMTQYTKLLKNGLLPNYIPENPAQEATYNCVDATMWWFNTIHHYLRGIESQPVANTQQQTSFSFLQAQYEGLRKVVQHQLYGRFSGRELTVLNPAMSVLVDSAQEKLPVGPSQTSIGMAQDGLIAMDSPTQTWMDVVSGGQAVTPRSGKAVEINALWYNGLKTMAELAKWLQRFQRSRNPQGLTREQLENIDAQLNQDIGRYEGLAAIVKDSMQKFWNPQKQCLYDIIDSSTPGAQDKIRPNQIIAASLPYRALYPEQERGILNTIEEHLLTPYGLRSLSPKDKDYKPYYPNAAAGEREKSYHQGTVWSWLIGPYLDASLNVMGISATSIQQAQDRLRPLLDHLQGKVEAHQESGCMIGGISEIFDAQEPHYSKGAVNQAWSVGEVLRQQVKLSRLASVVCPNWQP